MYVMDTDTRHARFSSQPFQDVMDRLSLFLHAGVFETLVQICSTTLRGRGGGGRLLSTLGLAQWPWISYSRSAGESTEFLTGSRSLAGSITWKPSVLATSSNCGEAETKRISVP